MFGGPGDTEQDVTDSDMSCSGRSSRPQGPAFPRKGTINAEPCVRFSFGFQTLLLVLLIAGYASSQITPRGTDSPTSTQATTPSAGNVSSFMSATEMPPAPSIGTTTSTTTPSIPSSSVGPINSHTTTPISTTTTTPAATDPTTTTTQTSFSPTNVSSFMSATEMPPAPSIGTTTTTTTPSSTTTTTPAATNPTTTQTQTSVGPISSPTNITTNTATNPPTPSPATTRSSTTTQTSSSPINSETTTPSSTTTLTPAATTTTTQTSVGPITSTLITTPSSTTTTNPTTTQTQTSVGPISSPTNITTNTAPNPATPSPATTPSSTTQTSLSPTSSPTNITTNTTPNPATPSPTTTPTTTTQTSVSPISSPTNITTNTTTPSPTTTPTTTLPSNSSNITLINPPMSSTPASTTTTQTSVGPISSPTNITTNTTTNPATPSPATTPSSTTTHTSLSPISSPTNITTNTTTNPATPSPTPTPTTTTQTSLGPISSPTNITTNTTTNPATPTPTPIPTTTTQTSLGPISSPTNITTNTTTNPPTPSPTTTPPATTTTTQTSVSPIFSPTNMTTTLPTNSSNITLINPRMSSTNTTASPNDTTTYLNINDTGIHYWMEVSVNVTGPTKTEKELRSWFSQLFSDSSCMSSQYPSSSPIPRGKGHSDSQLLKGIEVRCSNVTDIRMAKCFVILWMEPTVHPCCLLQTLCQAGRFQSHNISGTTQSVRRMENLIKDNSSSNCDSIPYGCNATVPENKTCADLSTAFIPTGSLSNNCSTPVEDKIIPTATDLSTDVYYSTLINVSVSGDTKNESDVNLWLQELFDAHLDGCMTTTITPAMPSSTNDLPSSKLRGLDVFCAITTEIRTTSCNVVLKVERGVEPCCLLRILCQAGNHSSSHISGTAQRMDSTGIMKPSNSNSECGDSVLESCMALPPDNATCRNNFTVFSPQNQTCPTEEQVDRNQHPCNCSAFCNGTDTYYTFKLHFNKDDLDLLYSIPYLISGLGTQCTNDSGSTCLPQIANSYKDNKVDCAGGSEVSYCTVILSFSGEHSICDVSAALKRSFYIMRDMYTIGQLNRAALCGNATYQDNPLNSSFTWYKLDLTPSEFCLPNATNFLNCQQASYVVELSEHCEQSGSTAGPYTNTTFLPLNTTLPNMNMTSSPENTTYSPLNTTSSPLNTTYSPLNTTYSPENTTYSPLNTTSSPLNTTYSPLNTTSSPLNTTSSPMNVTSIPLNTTSIPLNTTSSPMNVTSIPLNTTSIPLNTTSSPMNVTSIPQNTTSIPLNTTSSPMNTTSIPLNMTSSPMNVTLSPPNVTSRPVNTTAIPVDITGNVTVTTPNMTPTSNTTLNNVSTTNEILTTAFNGSTGGFTTELPTTGPSSTTQMSNEAAADLLLQQTRNVSSLNSSQVDQLVSELGRLLEGPNVSVALGNTSVHIVSNLLGASQSVLASSSQRIVEIVDTVGLKLVFETDTEELLSDSLALSVKAVDGANFRETTFSITDPANVQVRDSSRRSRSLRSTVPQGSIRLPPTLTQNLNSEEQQQASRVQFNFYQTGTVFQDPQLGTRRLISGILGASVANLSIAGLQENVTVNLRNTEPVPGNYVAICVFWDLSRNDGRGGWNSDGCFLENSTDSVTTCSCNHLTSFAILLDLSREPLTDPLQATILTFITYIGCGLSAIFLSLTLLTYLAFEKLRKDMPSKILIQLCLALLMLNMVFLVDSWLSLYPDVLGLCISTAWFLHYFLLASFTWMGLEAVHMYLALVKVFNTYVSHYMLKFSLVGWGVPLVVVIIVIAVDKDNYGMVTYSKFENGTSDGFCWLLNDTVFYVGVVAYFCVIFLFNSIMFVVVMVQLHRILRQNPHSTQHRSTLQDLRRVAGVTILLGLTWGFAFFAWGPVNLAFMYLFTIFNTLQGFFIFVFHCAVKENVRRQWRTYLCCGKLRLAENSDWSRTATQKIDKRSAVSRLTSLSSSESNSSSDSSFLARERPEQLRGIANPLTEQAITADEALSSDNTRDEAEHPHSL